jgi:DNA-binding NtrC family response regulator
VRELRNAVARRIALGELDEGGRARDGRMTAASDDGVENGEAGDCEVADVLGMNLPFPKARRMVLDSFVRQYVARALRANGDNVAQAAAASGIARRYFQLLRDRPEK